MILHELISQEVACVAWRFWLGALSNKGGRGQRNHSCARLDKTAMLRRLPRRKGKEVQRRVNGVASVWYLYFCPSFSDAQISKGAAFQG